MCGRERKGACGQVATIVLSFAAVILLLSSGCDKAMESYKQGEDLLARNQYDQAVGRFELAFQQCRQKRGRDCAPFEERLSYARRLAGQRYYDLARAALVATRLDEAAKHIAKAIEYEPANAAYVDLRQRILDETLTVETLRRQAREHAAHQEWDAAIELMEQALARNSALSGAKSELARIRDDAYNSYYLAARGLFESGQWDEAIVQANRALQYREGAEARRIIAEIANRGQALEFIEQARALRASGADPQSVLEVLEKARRLYPSHPEIAALILEAKQAACDVKIAQALQAMDSGALHGALQLLHESTGLLSNYGGAAELIGVVSERIAQRHTETGDMFRRRQQYGNAALHYVTAMNYRSDFASARSGLAEVLRPLRESVAYRVGYVGFNSARQDRGIAQAIETGLLGHISRSRPANVIINDVSGFKATLGAINTSIVDVDIVNVRIESAWPKDADALMMGQVVGTDVSTSEMVTYGRSRFQSGTQMQPNPEHGKIAARIESLFGSHVIALAELATVKVRAEKMMQPRPGDGPNDLRDRRREAGRMVAAADKKAAGLQAELEKARQQLTHTPPHLAIPIMSEYEYPIRRLTQTARIDVFFKVVDARTGAVLVAEKLDGAFAAEDTCIAPDPARNVPGDPLELPAADFLMQKATEQVMGKLFGLCDAYLQSHSRRFVAIMDQSNSDGDTETAVEYGMRYLISPGNGGGDRNRTIAFLRTVIAQRNEDNAPDLNSLLARYYRP